MEGNLGHRQWYILQPYSINIKKNKVPLLVGLTTTYAISSYHHWCCEFDSQSGRGVQQYVINFVGDLRHVGSLLRVSGFLHQ
jgi:hypothetical protein